MKWAVLLTIFWSSILFAGEKSTIRQTFKDLKSLEFWGEGKVYLSQGEENEIILEGSPENIKDLDLSIENGNLFILNKSGPFKNVCSGFTCQLKVKNLEEIVLHGTVYLKSTQLNMPGLQLFMYGDTFADMTVVGENFSAVIEGHGKLIVDGKVRNQEIEMNSEALYHGDDLVSENTSIKIIGDARANVAVSKYLNVMVAEKGQVYYAGSPILNQLAMSVEEPQPVVKQLSAEEVKECNVTVEKFSQAVEKIKKQNQARISQLNEIKLMISQKDVKKDQINEMLDNADINDKIRGLLKNVLANDPQTFKNMLDLFAAAFRFYAKNAENSYFAKEFMQSNPKKIQIEAVYNSLSSETKTRLLEIYKSVNHLDCSESRLCEVITDSPRDQSIMKMLVQMREELSTQLKGIENKIYLLSPPEKEVGGL